MKQNPLSKLLELFVRQSSQSQEETASKLGISRRSLYNAMSVNKKLDSFKLGVLKKITALYPITIQISRGKIEVFRWDTIVEELSKSDASIE